MTDIHFQLGQNIIETARQSGTKKYKTEQVGGALIFECWGIPPDATLRYTAPGFDLAFTPIVSFDMWADRERANNLAVDSADLTLGNVPDDHAGAHAFARKIVAQFQRGKWQRYVPLDCPRVTGHSAILDADGKLGACPIDPEWDVPPEVWVAAAGNGAEWNWVGDGVLATFEVMWSYMTVDPKDGVDYRATVKLESLEAKAYYEAKNAKYEEERARANGWPVTSKAVLDANRAKRLAACEAAALKRGDRVLPRP